VPQNGANFGIGTLADLGIPCTDWSLVSRVEPLVTVPDGTRWLAPCDRTGETLSPGIPCTDWSLVSRVEPLVTVDDYEARRRRRR